MDKGKESFVKLVTPKKRFSIQIPPTFFEKNNSAIFVGKICGNPEKIILDFCFNRKKKMSLGKTTKKTSLFRECEEREKIFGPLENCQVSPLECCNLKVSQKNRSCSCQENFSWEN